MNSEKEVWPPSNYAIFLAQVLLLTTASALSLNEEKIAEDFAIYAYFLLAIGAMIRFFEFMLPENSTHILIMIWKRFPELHTLSWTVTRIRMAFIWMKHKAGKKRENFSEISRNITISLFLFLIISVIYGIVFDWGTVGGYLFKPILDTI